MIQLIERRSKALSACLLLAGALLMACSPGRQDEASDPGPSTTSVATEVTSPAPAPTLPTGPALSPLTGTPAPAGTADRDAVVVKVDNQFGAGPPAGVNQADVVFELLVEGVTRFGAVFQSAQPELVGPVRSARTSDPALFEMLNWPVLAFSGANDGTLRLLESSRLRPLHPDASTTPWQEDPTCDPPHNLFASVAALRQEAPPGHGPPVPLFRYRSGPRADRPCSEAGLAIEFYEDDVVSFVWDCAAGRWLRYRNGRADVDVEGGPIWAMNVVVLDTVYQSGSADNRSPEAVTLGMGGATALVDGAVVEGSWTREATTSPPALLAASGAPLELAPGRTWIALPPPRRTRSLEAAEVRNLLAS